jgi:hypothetical protein
LTRLFTPLCTALLLAFLAAMGWTGRGIDVQRNVLIGFDLLLALVLGLLLYAISARDPHARPDTFDALQVLLVCSALVVDILALAAIAARIAEFGFSPNKLERFLVVHSTAAVVLLSPEVPWLRTRWICGNALRARGTGAWTPRVSPRSTTSVGRGYIG